MRYKTCNQPLKYYFFLLFHFRQQLLLLFQLPPFFHTNDLLTKALVKWTTQNLFFLPVSLGFLFQG